MSEWAVRPLSEVADIIMGQSPGGDSCNQEGNGLPFLQGCGDFGAQHPATNVCCTTPLRSAKSPSVLISVRAPVGTMNVADQTYCIGRGLAAFSAKPGKADNTFLMHAVEHNLAYLHRRSQGSTFAAVSSADLRGVPIPKVDFEGQQRIAAIFCTVNTAITQTEALIAKYQQIKAGLMHDLFTRGVLRNGQLRPPREQAPHLYKQTELGWIPAEWRVSRMIDLAEKRKGATTIGPFGSDLVAKDYQVEGVPIVFVRDIKPSGFEWNSDTYVTKQKATQLDAHTVKAGDVLVTKMGLPPCLSCLYPEWMPDGVITADIIRLSPDRSMVDPYWLVEAINQDRVVRQVAAITAGVTRPKVTLADFRSIKIVTPDLEEQLRMSNKLRVAQERIQAEATRIAKLKQQKLGLMQDLLTGKVTVAAKD